MNDLEQAKSMLRIAHRDFNVLLAMAHSPLCADEIFGFHAQQAVEKTLKAWLCIKGMIYPHSHELPRLLTLLENSGADIEDFWPLARFTPYAVQSRYEEGPVAGVPPLNREDVILEIQALLERVGCFIEKADSTGRNN